MIFGIKIKAIILASVGSFMVVITGGMYHLLVGFKDDYATIKQMIPKVEEHSKFIESQKSTNNTLQNSLNLLNSGQTVLKEGLEKLGERQERGFSEIVRLFVTIKPKGE